MLELHVADVRRSLHVEVAIVLGDVDYSVARARCSSMIFRCRPFNGDAGKTAL